jgi:negative regulator of flagellin synthesis FlgM
MMKIQGNSPNHETSSASRLDSTKQGRTGSANRSAGSGSDRVELSSDAQLASTAVRAANDAPAIRQDRVDAAKQKLMEGKIGQDTMKLADRLIDHLLER